MSHRVGAYVRISEDLEGRGLGVGRQRQDCESVAQQRGWEIVDVYEDNDVSAFKSRVVRKEFERLIADLDAGTIDGVVVYDLDRFARKPVDLERAIDIFDRRRGRVFATVQADVDLSTSDGRTMARVMVAFANKSSMDTARRVRRKHLELAQAGVPVGGTRPFGWQPDRRSLDEAEAGLIRTAAEQILAGVGLHTICRAWNESGVRTPRGNLWRRSVLKNLMTSPRLAGYRVYQGEIARDTDGQPVKGQYDAILEIEVWESVRSALTERVRGRAVHMGGRKYLLTGIARCSLCSNLLTGNAVAKYNNFYYACRPPTDGRGCGKVSVSGKGLDALITDLVLEYLSEVRVETDVGDWPGEKDLEDAAQRITELMDAYARRELSAEAVFPSVATLEVELSGLRADRDAWRRTRDLSDRRPTDVAGSWPDLPVEQRRTIIESVLQAVVVRPSTKRSNRFDPERVEVVWR